MGVININIAGSFVGQFGIQGVTERFEAMHNGHADAVARAIEYLSGTVLPRAIALDHQLQAEGVEPTKGFTPERILTTR
jgi:hypothetical protein